jgi:hypothetical protein
MTLSEEYNALSECWTLEVIESGQSPSSAVGSPRGAGEQKRSALQRWRQEPARIFDERERSSNVGLTTLRVTEEGCHRRPDSRRRSCRCKPKKFWMRREAGAQCSYFEALGKPNGWPPVLIISLTTIILRRERLILRASRNCNPKVCWCMSTGTTTGWLLSLLSWESGSNIKRPKANAFLPACAGSRQPGKQTNLMWSCGA